MAPLAQTITIVNKSGKVMSTSKHLVDVFKEAQAAYRERKAELKAARKEETSRLEALKSSDTRSESSSKASSRRRHSTHRHGSQRSSKPKAKTGHHSTRRSKSQSPTKPPIDRGYSDTFYAAETPRPIKRSPTAPVNSARLEHDFERMEIARRHSHNDALIRRPQSVDMDLAYGELPPPLPVRRHVEEEELREKMTTLQRMLEEANCLQHSATAIIKSLESKPEAMAAVALTLAEISNLARKLAPGALGAIGKATPAVMALLLSPEFLIAVGLGVGITVVTFGGYKIIKKIQGKQKMKMEAQGSTPAATEEVPTSPTAVSPSHQQSRSDGQQLEQLDVDLSHIEHWRRGVTDAEVASVGTSVEGEFITPHAAADLRSQGILPAAKGKDKKGKGKESDKKHRKEKKAGPSKQGAPSLLRAMFKRDE